MLAYRDNRNGSLIVLSSAYSHSPPPLLLIACRTISDDCMGRTGKTKARLRRRGTSEGCMGVEHRL